MNRRRLCLFVILLLPALCPGCFNLVPQSPEELQAEYATAIVDAATAEPDEIVPDLVAIVDYNDELIWDETGDTRRVLVVTWTSWEGYDDQVNQTIETTREIWVTVAPQVQEFAARHLLTGSALTLRLEQLLGLPPDSGKTRFVEFWVAPDDLFRPSPDPEISDHEAELDFPVSADFVSVSAAHVTWFNDLAATSYGADGYPWTRLGYTYDWGAESGDVGLSEFVIRAGAQVEVHTVATTADYCRW